MAVGTAVRVLPGHRWHAAGLNRPSNPNHVPLPGNFYPLTVGPNWSPTGTFPGVAERSKR